MWSLQGGYPRKQVSLPISRESALGEYNDGLQPLRQVQLSTLSPVMWSLNGGYPRKQMSVPIGQDHGLGMEFQNKVYIGTGIAFVATVLVAAWLFWPRPETLGDKLFRAL